MPKRKTESYATYIRKVLKQVHPDAGITKNAVEVIDDLLDHAFERLAEALLAALDRIRKRLGGARHQYLRGELEAALDQQRHGGDVERHRVWIRELLSGYYDPMYDYMLQRRDGPILYQGSRAQVMEYLSHRG